MNKLTSLLHLLAEVSKDFMEGNQCEYLYKAQGKRGWTYWSVMKKGVLH